MKNKVAHVKSAVQSRPHGCHWPGCTAQVPPAMWGCKKHWYRLPHKLRMLVWSAYKPGQEERLDPSPRYIRVANKVQAWIAEHGGDT